MSNSRNIGISNEKEEMLAVIMSSSLIRRGNITLKKQRYPKYGFNKLIDLLFPYCHYVNH